MNIEEIEQTTSHRWKRDKFGHIDDQAWEYEFHNGPICEVCGWSPCVHCLREGSEKIQPCTSATADGGGI